MISDLFPVENYVHNLRVKEFQIPRFEAVTYGKHSLRYKGPTLWNKIGVDIWNFPSNVRSTQEGHLEIEFM